MSSTGPSWSDRRLPAFFTPWRKDWNDEDLTLPMVGQIRTADGSWVFMLFLNVFQLWWWKTAVGAAAFACVHRRWARGPGWSCGPA
ncbi:hypothetical protein [Streptomyces griseorubiginosus]|uniref:hypothetical protein n=1 Tax=Streptomyces griseorubiginosus TaxID=67304 RepID=UPI0036598A33